MGVTLANHKRRAITLSWSLCNLTTHTVNNQGSPPHQTITMSSAASTSGSSSTAARRLIHELKQYESSENTNVASLGPISDTDLLHWEAVLLGPPGTPYEGCKWNIDIKIPERYPSVPPIMTFKTPCCHPNVHLKVPFPHSP